MNEKRNEYNMSAIEELSALEKKAYLVDSVIKTLINEEPQKIDPESLLPEKKEAVYKEPPRRKVRPRPVNRPNVVLKDYPPRSEHLVKKTAEYPVRFSVDQDPGNEWSIVQWFLITCAFVFLFCLVFFAIIPHYYKINYITKLVFTGICFFFPIILSTIVVLMHNYKVELIGKLNDALWNTQLEIYHDEQKRLEEDAKKQEWEAEKRYKNACQLIKEENDRILLEAEKDYQNALRTASIEAEQAEEKLWLSDITKAKAHYELEKKRFDEEFRDQLKVRDQNFIYYLIKREVINNEIKVWKRAKDILYVQKEELYDKSDIYRSQDYCGMVFAVMAEFYLKTGICNSMDGEDGVYPMFYSDIKNRCGIKDLAHIDAHIDELAEYSDVIRNFADETKRKCNSIMEEYRQVYSEAIVSFLGYLNRNNVQMHYVSMTYNMESEKSSIVEKWKQQSSISSFAKTYIRDILKLTVSEKPTLFENGTAEGSI